MITFPLKLVFFLTGDAHAVGGVLGGVGGSCQGSISAGRTQRPRGMTRLAGTIAGWLIRVDSGPRARPPSDLWGVEEDRDDPDMLAVERMRRPAAELGPNWLEIMMGRAREDGVAGW